MLLQWGHSASWLRQTTAVLLCKRPADNKLYDEATSDARRDGSVTLIAARVPRDLEPQLPASQARYYFACGSKPVSLDQVGDASCLIFASTTSFVSSD